MAEQQLPVWNSEGVEPPANLQRDGWQPGVKPPAQYFDWLFNRAYKCIEELQAITEALETNKANGEDLTTLDNKVTQHLEEINPHQEVTDRNIYVGSTREFKTIQSAVSSVKKNLGGKSIVIFVDEGVYDEGVSIRGFHYGSLEIASYNGNKTSVKIKTINVADCTAVIRLSNFLANFSGLEAVGLSISTSTFVHVANVVTGAYTPVAGSYGISVFHSNAMISGCTISAYSVAIYVAATSIVYAANNTGSNNSVGLSCYGGSTIGKEGAVPGAATAESTWSGGVIR